MLEPSGTLSLSRSEDPEEHPLHELIVIVLVGRHVLLQPIHHLDIARALTSRATACASA